MVGVPGEFRIALGTNDLRLHPVALVPRLPLSGINRQLFHQGESSQTLCESGSLGEAYQRNGLAILEIGSFTRPVKSASNPYGTGVHNDFAKVRPGSPGPAPFPYTAKWPLWPHGTF